MVAPRIAVKMHFARLYFNLVKDIKMQSRMEI